MTYVISWSHHNNPTGWTLFKNKKTEALRGPLPNVAELVNGGNIHSHVHLVSGIHSCLGDPTTYAAPSTPPQSCTLLNDLDLWEGNAENSIAASSSSS